MFFLIFKSSIFEGKDNKSKGNREIMWNYRKEMGKDDLGGVI